MAVIWSLLLCKAWWFFFGGIGLIYAKFQYPYLTSLGLKANQVGTMAAISSITAAVMSPLAGALADKTQRRRAIMILLLSAFIAVASGLPWTGAKLSLVSIQHNCTNANASLSIADAINRSMVHSSEVLAPTSDPCMPANASTSTLFYAMMVMFVSLTSFLLPNHGLFQSITLNIIANTPSHTQGIGSQMMFFPIGAGTWNFLTGLVADNVRFDNMSGYMVVFLMVPVLALPLLPLTFIIFKYTRWKNTSNDINIANDTEETLQLEQERNKGVEESEKLNEIPVEQNITRVQMLKTVLKKPSTLLLLATYLLNGFLLSIMNSFSFLLMKDEMNASKTSMGLSSLVQCASMTVVYSLTDRIIPILGGPIPTIEVALFLQIVRVVGMSLVRNPWLMVLPMLVNGAEPMCTVSMMRYMHARTPTQIHSTMFTLLSCLQFALGPCLSHIIGGRVYEAYGGRAMYRGAGAVAGTWILILVLYFHVVSMVRKRMSPVKDEVL